MSKSYAVDKKLLKGYLQNKEFKKGKEQRKLVVELVKKTGLKYKYEISKETIIADICKTGDLETLQFVFSCFADEDLQLNSEDNKDYFRQTPFFNAVSRNKLDIANLLLEYGADINIPGINGNTLLQFFLLKRYSKTQDEQRTADNMLNYLFSKHDMGHRLDFAHKNGEQDNVFHIVAKNKDMESAIIIFDLMADNPESIRLCINAHSSYKEYTPLDVCCTDVLVRINEINELNNNQYTHAYGSPEWLERMLYLRKRFVSIFAMIDLLLAFGANLESIKSKLDALPSFRNLFNFYENNYSPQSIYTGDPDKVCPICFEHFTSESDIVLLLPVIKNNIFALPATEVIEQLPDPFEPPTNLYLCHHMFHRECIDRHFETKRQHNQQIGCAVCNNETNFIVSVKPVFESQMKATASQSNTKKGSKRKGGKSNKITRKLYLINRKSKKGGKSRKRTIKNMSKKP